MDNKLTASRIKEICKSKHIAVSKLLSDCDIRKGLIYDMEKRDLTPSAAILEQIADYLNCSVDYLLGRTVQQEEAVSKDRDGPNKKAQQFMSLVDRLTPDQQKLLLAQLQAWTDQNQQ